MIVLRFGVENYGCFRDRVELSFVSTAQKDEPGYRIQTEVCPHGVLPVLGVFGANASGKSILLNALMDFRNHVRQSFKLQPEDQIPWKPWRFQDEGPESVTQFDLDFLLDGIRHHYGFRHNGRVMLEEWLHRWPRRHRQVVFERNELSEDPWYFGPSFTGARAHLSRLTRRNGLFLSTAAQCNHEELTVVHQAISHGIREEAPIDIRGCPLFVEGAPILNEKRRKEVERIVRSFDLGCTGIRVEKFSTELPSGIEDILKPEALEQIKRARRSDVDLFRVCLERRGRDGTCWTLPFHEESTGTNILLQRINDLMSLESGLLVVDELDTSLHSEICEYIIQTFTTESLNTKPVQLLFSTHDQGLLSHLRRDETILVDKDAEGASTICAASDYRGLRGGERLRVAYKAGRIGGVPVVAEPRSFWERL